MAQPNILGINAVKLKQLKLMIVKDTILFPGMKKLKLRGKDLHVLPREIFLIDELDVLDLSPEREACMEFKLHRIPMDVGRMVNLKVLIVDLSGIRYIPDEVANCTNLEKLSLSNNLIAQLPQTFSQLKNLTTLHLANNWLKIFPDVICDMVSLEFLDVSDNLISIIPPEIGQLKELISFVMCQNKVNEIPGEIGELENLLTLWMGGNKLEQLPEEIAQLKKLDWGGTHTVSTALDGNPLVHPPLEVCKKGIKAIKKYFVEKSKEENDTQTYHIVSQTSDFDQ